MADKAPTVGTLGGYGMLTTLREGIKRLIKGLGDKQDKLTAGDNITISDGTISAKDTTYTAGTNITISDENVISAEGSSYTAGDGISISENGVISVNHDWIECENKVADIITYKDDYEFKIIVDNNFIYMLYDASNCESGKSIKIFNGICDKDSSNISEQNNIMLFSNGYRMFSLRQGSPGSGFNLNVKLYDLDGTAIDATTIDNYIDSNNKSIKLFICDLSGFVCIVGIGNSYTSALNMSHSSTYAVFTGYQVSMSQLINYVKNGTNISNQSVSNIIQISDNSYNNLNNVVIYRRKKNI